jgi:hypothetical protein
VRSRLQVRFTVASSGLFVGLRFGLVAGCAQNGVQAPAPAMVSLSVQATPPAAVVVVVVVDELPMASMTTGSSKSETDTVAVTTSTATTRTTTGGESPAAAVGDFEPAESGPRRDPDGLR